MPGNADAFGKDGEQEILEEFDEAKEKLWREEHRQKVRAQKELERNQRLGDQQSGDKKSDKDIFAMLDELELMEELDTELEAMNIENDEMLLEIMNGVRKLPEPKNRTAHTRNESTPLNDRVCENASVESGKFWAAPTSSKITDLTNNNSVQNNKDFGDASDTDESVASEDDLPAECRFYYQQAESLENVEKLQFYKHHLAEVQSYLETTNVRTYDEFVSKTDKMFVADYLLNEIDRIRDLINSKEVELSTAGNGPSPIAAIVDVADKSDGKQTTASHRRSVKFSNEDDVKSFSKCEEPRMVSNSSSEKVSTEEQPASSTHYKGELNTIPIDATTEEKERMKENIMKIAQMNVAEVKEAMDSLYKKVRFFLLIHLYSYSI